MIFVVAFVFSIVIGVLSNAFSLLSVLLKLDFITSSWVALLIQLVSFFVSPILLFASFYVIGIKIDVVTEFLGVVVSLFLGSCAGHLIGYFSLEYILISQYGVTISEPWFLWRALSLLRNVFSFEFFVGFAALSMAYIVRKRSP